MFKKLHNRRQQRKLLKVIWNSYTKTEAYEIYHAMFNDLLVSSLDYKSTLLRGAIQRLQNKGIKIYKSRIGKRVYYTIYK